MPDTNRFTARRVLNSIRYRTYDKALQAMTDRKIANYVKNNNLQPLIEEARQATNSTGADYSDYVLLHQFIRSKKPKYVLECGTGLTTWIMADALQQNWSESGQDGESKQGMVISIEEHQDWYNHAVSVIPDRYKPFVNIRHSPRQYFHYSFVFGVTYADIPDYPYELAFVDGPICRYYPDGSTGEPGEVFQHTAAMDVVKLLLERDLNMTVLIDNLKRTQIAYSCLFRPGILKNYKFLSNIGVLESVSRSDLIIDSDRYIPIFEKIVDQKRSASLPSF